jgi:hypothetical protein
MAGKQSQFIEANIKADIEAAKAGLLDEYILRKRLELIVSTQGKLDIGDDATKITLCLLGLVTGVFDDLRVGIQKRGQKINVHLEPCINTSQPDAIPQRAEGATVIPVPKRKSQ